MANNYRKLSLVFAAVAFIAAATNVMLVLHLAEHGHGKGHDSEKCPTCQQAVINASAAIQYSAPRVCQVNEISFKISDDNFFSPQTVKFRIPLLRAPPSVR